MHVIGTAGHVDHGKSSLVKALTQMDPDRFEEEKRRGLTIDLGFAWFTLASGREVGLVDVPGHERFIKNMLSGVGGIDAALFVVAADEGWKPQSAEHLEILDFLEVRSAIIVITRIDLVDAERLAEVQAQVREHVATSVLADAPMVAVSSVTGDGIEQLRAEIDSLTSGLAESADRGRPRLFVDRVFTIAGAGTVVTGTLTGGTLSEDEEVELLPSGNHARIRSLQTHQQPVKTAVPGSRVAANLVGLEKSDVIRGEAVVRPGSWQQIDNFAARLKSSARLGRALTEKGAYELYIGSTEIPCRIKFLQDPEHVTNGLNPGASTYAQIFTMRPVPVEPMDRFVIRDVGRWETVAGGMVLDPDLGRVRCGERDVLERLESRESSVRDDLVTQVVFERRVVARKDLARLTGAAPQRIEDLVNHAVASGQLVATPSMVIDSNHAAALKAAARDEVEAHHTSKPLESGLPREALRKALGLEPRPFSELVDVWIGEGLVETAGADIRLPGRGTQMTEADRAVADAAIAKLVAAGASPPDPSEAGLTPELTRALEKMGEVVTIAPSLVYAHQTISDIEQRVVDLITQSGPATVSAARDAIGTSRKYAVPLLEHLDATGVTQRDGDVRALGPRGRKLAGQTP